MPVGTGALLWKRIRAQLHSRGLDHLNLEIISNPEFLQEGMAVRDCLSPERVVVGAQSENARDVMRRLYSNFVSSDRILFMDPSSAEITKYAANTMLAARISMMNEIALLCDRIGADVESVRKALTF